VRLSWAPDHIHVVRESEAATARTSNEGEQ
jgi:hypothetical protein